MSSAGKTGKAPDMARTSHFRTLFLDLLDALADDRGRSLVPGSRADGVAVCPHILALSERLQRGVRVHHSGPDLTVDSTIFEFEMGL